MGLGEISTAVRQRLLSAGEDLRTIPAWLGSFLYGKAVTLADKLFGKIPQNMRKPVLIGLGGAVCLLIIIIVVLLAGRAGNGKRAGDFPVMAAGPAVPAEDLFLPAEPDFLPEALLEREPHRPWTTEDVAPYWENLKDGHENEWRAESSAVIDDLMESVP
jgi:hypothetical protein